MHNQILIKVEEIRNNLELLLNNSKEFDDAKIKMLFLNTFSNGISVFHNTHYFAESFEQKKLTEENPNYETIRGIISENPFENHFIDNGKDMSVITSTFGWVEKDSRMINYLFDFMNAYTKEGIKGCESCNPKETNPVMNSESTLEIMMHQRENLTSFMKAYESLLVNIDTPRRNLGLKNDELVELSTIGFKTGYFLADTEGINGYKDNFFLRTQNNTLFNINTGKTYSAPNPIGYNKKVINILENYINPSN